MYRRPFGVLLVLSTLLVGSFANLCAHPTALIVDADRPSLDHARRVDDPVVGNDLTRLFLPHHLAISRLIARLGHLPLWDDRGFGGRPMVGNPQAGLFYPPVWLAWWSGSPAALGWITIAHLLFSGVGAFRLGQTLGMGGWGSLVAAGCVQLSPYVLAQAFEGHYPHVWAACWYPWAFDALIKIRRGDLRSAPILTMILAATFLAGHPQEGYYLLNTLSLWVISSGIAAIRAGRPLDGYRLWGGWAGVMILAMGIVSVELIPDAMAQNWSLRGARMSLRMADRYHLDPINAFQLLSPGALGGPSDYFGHENYWETVTSIGFVPLVLASIGASWSTDRRAVRGWLLLVGASLAFASGRKLGLFALMYEVVPGMDRFRVPARSLFLASLGASMLAGLGVDALRARWNERWAWARLTRGFAIRASVLATVVLVVGLFAKSGEFTGSTGPSREVDRVLLASGRLARDPKFFGALGGVTLLLAFGWWRPGDRRAIAAAIGLLGLVELGIHGHALLVTTAADRFLGPDPISKALLEARPPGLEPPRIRVVDALYDDLRAGQIEFSKTNVNDSFQIQHAADLYRTLYHHFDDVMRHRDGPMDSAVAGHRLAIRRAVLDRMGVSLLVDNHVDAEAQWPLVASGEWRDSTFAVHRNPSTLPRAYVVPRAVLAEDDASILLTFRDHDAHDAVLMATADPLGPDASHRQPFTPAEWTSTDPDRVVLRVSTQAPGLLVVADTWMPGWSAVVDGDLTPILRGNHAQSVISIPRAGHHEIVMIYRTPGLTFGLAMTSVSLLIWTSLVACLRRNDPTRPASDDCH